MLSFPQARPLVAAPQAGVASGHHLSPTVLAPQAFSSNDPTGSAGCNEQNIPGFENTRRLAAERSQSLPAHVVEHISRQPISAALFTHYLSFVPRAAGRSVQRPEGDWSHILCLCLSGVGHLTVAGIRRRLTRGNFVLLKPFQPHRYEADAEDPWSYYCVHFHGTLAAHYGDAIEAALQRTPVSVGSNVRFVEAFERILGIFSNGYSQQNLTLASVATHQLLGEVLCLAQETGEPQQTIADRVDRTLEVIHRNPSMHASIPELAAHANMSRSYFVAQFHKRTGTSPRNYINRLRIVKACELLQSGSGKVESIAQALGFSDPFYFCRVFKQIVGRTPSEHRQAGALPQNLASPRRERQRATSADMQTPAAIRSA